MKAMEIQLVVGLFGFCSPVQSTTGSTVSSGTLLPLGVESGPLVSSWPSATLPHPELSVAFEGLLLSRRSLCAAALPPAIDWPCLLFSVRLLIEGGRQVPWSRGLGHALQIWAKGTGQP